MMAATTTPNGAQAEALKGNGAMAQMVLIAEDEAFIVESLTFLLTHAGYDVCSVDDGAAALDAMLRSRPDLFILDIMIPTMNGFDVLRKMRAMPELADLPVLALTAKGQEEDRRRMLDLGADDFVTKPFSNADLMARVGRLLGGMPAGSTVEA